MSKLKRTRRGITKDEAAIKKLESRDDKRNYMFYASLLGKKDLWLCFCCGSLLPRNSYKHTPAGRQTSCRDCARLKNIVDRDPNSFRVQCAKEGLAVLQSEFSRTLRESLAAVASEHFSEDQMGAMISAARTMVRGHLTAKAEDQMADSVEYAKRFEVDVD